MWQTSKLNIAIVCRNPKVKLATKVILVSEKNLQIMTIAKKIGTRKVMRS